MKKKVIKLTESDLEKLVKKIINEVGGYDDPMVMGQHATKSVNELISAHQQLSVIISDISNKIMDGELTIENSENYLKDIIENIEIVIGIGGVVIKDFTEDNLIVKTKKFHRTLNSFIKKLRILMSQSRNFVKNDDEYVDMIKDFLVEMVPIIKEYEDELKATTDTFNSRFNNFKKGDFF